MTSNTDGAALARINLNLSAAGKQLTQEVERRMREHSVSPELQESVSRFRLFLDAWYEFCKQDSGMTEEQWAEMVAEATA